MLSADRLRQRIGIVWLNPIPWGLSMPQIVAIGYIAITVSDLEATCTFYDELFGVRTHLEPIAEGKIQVRQIALDGVASQRSPSGQ
jgi:hypothetical protein